MILQHSVGRFLFTIRVPCVSR